MKISHYNYTDNMHDVIVRPLSTVKYTSVASIFHSKQWSD